MARGNWVCGSDRLALPLSVGCRGCEHDLQTVDFGLRVCVFLVCELQIWSMGVSSRSVIQSAVSQPVTQLVSRHSVSRQSLYSLSFN